MVSYQPPITDEELEAAWVLDEAQAMDAEMTSSVPQDPSRSGGVASQSGPNAATAHRQSDAERPATTGSVRSRGARARQRKRDRGTGGNADTAGSVRVLDEEIAIEEDEPHKAMGLHPDVS